MTKHFGYICVKLAKVGEKGDVWRRSALYNDYSSKNLTDITYKLRDYTFKNKILKECIAELHDPTFESRIDANPHLIGFENGVYDLKEGIFRDEKPFLSLLRIMTGNGGLYTVEAPAVESMSLFKLSLRKFLF